MQKSTQELLDVLNKSKKIEEYYIYQYLNKEKYNDNTIVFGDFNSNQKFDKKYATRKERGHMACVNELKQLGLEDAYHYVTKETQGCETQNTFYLYRHLDKG